MTPAPSLPPPVPGEALRLNGRAGPMTVHVAGQGPPLLLVHSVNAAASAAEVRPLHLHYAATRTVFSPDLPGYGLSERSDRRYTPRLMTDALHDVAALIHQRCGPAPFDALAVSLASEFLARAAVERPAQFRSLALVSPTGFNGTTPRRGAPGSTREMPWLGGLFRGPGQIWGGALFRGLTRPGVIRHFLKKTWGSAAIDEDLWAYDVLTTRQAGAEFAPLCFLSGAMFSADIHTVYDALTLPVWASHGVRGDFTDYRGLAGVRGRPNWRITELPTGAMPYFELPQRFIADYDAFLSSP